MSGPAKKIAYGAARIKMAPLESVGPLGGGCQFIAGDPVELLRRKIDPHCNLKRRDGSAYCPKHHAMCCIRDDELGLR